MPELVQGEWPQVQTISTLSATPSQWALQYFSLLGGMQLQAAFAHFFVLGIASLPASTTVDHSDLGCPLLQEGW